MKPSITELAQGKPVAVFGAGSSGRAAQKLLESLGLESVVYAESASKKPSPDDANCREFSPEAAKGHALVVYSPAFRPDHKWIAEAEEAGATAICEPDLSALAWSGKIVAITGTNGKTTLTSFLTHALKLAGIDAIAAGNIGTPLSAFCPEFGSDAKKVAVCELSSFQTFRLKYLRPDALLWTNFAPDHLDWHKDMREYFDAKFNLVEAANGNPIFVGEDVVQAAAQYGKTLPQNARTVAPAPDYRAPAPFDSSIQSKNYAMAAAFLREAGLPAELPERAAKTFALPAYRFSKPLEVGSVRFFNDSKATNAHAAIAALEELGNEPDLIWLGGGKDKLCDLSELADAVAKHARAAVLIGQTAPKLAAMLEGRLADGAFVCDSMRRAVEKCNSLARKNTAVLFSPAFSSFGMFSGYAERGKSFESEVLCLKNLK